MTSIPPHPAFTAKELRTAAEMLDAFNREYDDPSPGADWLEGRLALLVSNGNTILMLARDQAGVAVLRLREALWSEDLECYIAEFYIRPGLRRKGLGTELMQACFVELLHRGASYVDLTTTEADSGARRFYEKLGFNCTEGCAEGSTAYYYERTLRPEACDTP